MKTTFYILVSLIIILTASHAFAGGWLIYHDGPYKGKVVDAETNEPIEGAAVVAVWYLERYGGAGGPVAKFFEAKETMTNKKGEFGIPSISGFHWWPFASLDKPKLIIFKPGYFSYKEYNYQIREGNVIKLPKVKTREDRSKALPDIGYAEYEGADDITPPRKKIPKIVDMIEREQNELGLR